MNFTPGLFNYKKKYHLMDSVGNEAREWELSD